MWGDQVFPVNTSVASTFDFSDLRVSAGYSFFRTPDKELGVGLGLHMAWYDVSLRTPATSGEGQDVLAPLPVLSIYGNFALTDRWAVGGRLDRFSLEYDKFSGGITQFALDLQYQPFKHVGFALGYRGLVIRAEVEEDRVTGKFRQIFTGPMALRERELVAASPAPRCSSSPDRRPSSRRGRRARSSLPS